MSSQTSGDSESSELAQRVLEEFHSPRSERNLQDLYVAISPPSLGALEEAVGELLERQRLRAQYLVRSPFGDHPGVKRFDSLREIPPTLDDEEDEEPRAFKVGLSNVEVVFSLPGGRANELNWRLP